MNDGIWQRSSFCSGGGNNCVEVAANDTDLVALRDSKQPESTMATNRAAFRALVRGIKSGAFVSPLT
ncbi:DUF397 domain-containing protein [Streptomyces sp. NPDC102274]|uniref:DUF397 domain-containing protein n=1 Tax=Streptomyces sp. NPDC102274 TaxID=3366151 RepID=UPI0037F3837B